MRNLAGPLDPWLGLVDAFGVGLMLVGWLLLRGAGARVRAVGAAAGAALLAIALAGVVGHAGAIASSLTFARYEEEGGRRFFDVLLALAGAGIGVAAALALRKRIVGYVAAADPADLAVPGPDVPDLDVADLDVPDDLGDLGVPGDIDGLDLPDDDPGSAVAPWLDLLLVALALALPLLLLAIPGGGVGAFGRHGGVTFWVVCLHLTTGMLAGGALYAALHTSDTDERWPVLAFGLVAAGVALTWVWPRIFSNEFWAVFAAGLSLGLLAVCGLALLARAVTGDRRYLAGGVLVAAVVVALAGFVSAKTSLDAVNGTGFIDLVNGGDDSGGDQGTVVPAVPQPVFPSFPGVPSFPEITVSPVP
jgi:hypothetical protein